MRTGAWIVFATLLGGTAVAVAGLKDDARMDDRNLTPEEQRVILHKGTERPFTGKYWDHHADGTYRCRRCGAPLFPSSAKFDSGTGWPSFDDALPGAVREVRDADGSRTEIVCARCGGHLGHVFRGEGFTGKGTRHCVNSLSLAFESAGSGTAAGPGTGTAREAARAPDEVTLAGTCAPGDPAPAAAPATQDAYFAGGCFWGVEYYLDKAPGVLKAESGYMGGHKADPSYREVCDGDTGHVETVHVVFDPSKTSYEALAKLFFEIHDPTQVDRQGPDVGEQYRSVVYVTNDAQRAVIRGLLDRLRLRGLAVATRIEPAGTFWPAEAYHQDYYDHKGGKPYCHARVERFGAE